MPLIPSKKNKYRQAAVDLDNRYRYKVPQASVDAALRGLHRPRLSLHFNYLLHSRAGMIALLALVMLMSGSAALLIRSSHAANPAPAPPVGNAPSMPSGTLAINPKVGSPSKANKAADSKAEWEGLTSTQKQILAPLASGWNNLSLSTRHKWIEVSKRFAAMSPAEQARVQDRMHDWVNLTPEQRRVVRENYARNRKLDTEQRAKRWAEYQQLPEAEKQKLAAEAAASNRKRVTAQVLSPPAKPKPEKPLELMQQPVVPPASLMPAEVTGH